MSTTWNLNPQSRLPAQGDFAHNLKLLQRYPPVDVQSLLVRAGHLKTVAGGGWQGSQLR